MPEATIILFPKPKLRAVVSVTSGPCALLELANEIAAKKAGGEPCPFMAQVNALANLFTGDES
jgi:hypothetical protein